MADTKLNDLNDRTTTAGTDIVYAVSDPSGSAADNKVSLNNLFKRGEVTTSSPVIDAAQTWNAGAVTFTGLKFNVTDTASASASLLMDLQVGGSSIFNVTKAGRVYAGAGAGGSPSYSFTAATGVGMYGSSLGIRFSVSSALVAIESTNLRLDPTFQFGFASANVTSALSPDTILTRRNTANLRLGAADAASPVAQTLSVQSVVAGTSNTAGANLTITGSQGTGTGAGGSIIFQVAPAGSSGTAQNALSPVLTIDSSRRLYISDGTNNSATGFQAGNQYYFTVLVTNTAYYSFTNTQFSIGSGNALGWSSSAAPGASALDTILARDAANTLALRNGNNGQTFRLYGRFTDITNNFERFFINAPTTSGDAVQLGTQKGATTGAARALEFQTDGTTRLTIAATSGNITTTGSVTTQAPTGGTAAAWRLGTVATVSPTSPNRTIEVDIGGTIYYISAKTTND